MSKDLLFGSIEQMKDALQTGQISCKELAQLHLDRIEAVNSTLTAVVHLNDQALDEAEKADQVRAQLKEIARVDR